MPQKPTHAKHAVGKATRGAKAASPSILPSHKKSLPYSRSAGALIPVPGLMAPYPSTTYAAAPYITSSNGKPEASAPPAARAPVPEDPERKRVEDCMALRERTVGMLSAWLLAIYRVEQSVGTRQRSEYGGGRIQTTGSFTRDIARSTLRDHRTQLGIYIAALRLQTCELVEAIEEWRGG